MNSLIKTPRQARARETVTAILDATVRVLNEGDADFTTNRVAEAAGVSPGTLYQYFANKEALVAGVIERGVMDVEDTLQATPMDASLPLEEVLAGTLTVVVTGLMPFGRLLSVVLATSPMVSRNGILTLLEPRLSGVVHLVLLQREDVRIRGGAAAIFVAVNSVVVTTLRWLADRPPWLALQDMVEALTRQCMAHVERVAPRGSQAP